MLELALQERDALIAHFGCSRRLAARVGALLGKRVALTATVLEEAKPDTPLERLLLSRELLQAEDPAAALAALQRDERYAAVAENLPLTVVEQAEWTVIAAEEETLAEAGFSRLDPNGAPPPSSATLPATRPPQPPAPAGESAGTTGAFTPQEVARLRVTVFTASESNQKVAALRQIAFTDLPDREKAAIFLQAAADEDAVLRAAAAQGLRRLGLEPQLADAARLFAEGTPAERNLAAERFVDLASQASPLGLDALMMAVSGALRDPRTPADLLRRTLATFVDLTGLLGAERVGNDDLLRAVIERMHHGGEALLPDFRQLLMALERTRPGWVSSYLLEEARNTRSTEYKGLMLEMMAGMDLDEARRAELVPLCAETFFQHPAGSPLTRTLGTFLSRIGDAGLRALAERMTAAGTAHQRQAVRLWDNYLRARVPDEATRVAMAEACLHLLKHAPMQVRIDILETRVAARDDLPAALRGEIAAAFLRDLNDYVQWPLGDTLELTLVRLGEPAVAPVVEALNERRDNLGGAVLAKALGRIGLTLELRDDRDLRRRIEALLRTLSSLSFKDTAFRSALHLAMGRICSRPGVSGDTVDFVSRTLLARLQGGPEDAATLEALGLCCRGTGVAVETVRTVAGLCLTHLQATQPDPSLTVDQIDGEELFRIGAETDIYADLIPACLSALRDIATAPHTPAALQEKIVTALLELWQISQRFEVVIGPQNVALLTESLGRIGAEPRLPPQQRVRIASSLAKGVEDVTVLEALAELLSQPDRLPQLHRMAAAVMQRLLKVLDDTGDLSVEDRETYLRILARVTRRGRFELRHGSVERLLTRAVDALIQGLKQGVPQVLSHLRALHSAERLPAHHQARVDAELARFTGLARR